MRSFIITAAATALFSTPGCNHDALDSGNPKPDLVIVFPDDGGGETGDDASQFPPNACGDQNPTCSENDYGPGLGTTFPLQTDMPPDPNASANSVSRDNNGNLKLDLSAPTFDFAWTSNTSDWQRGTVSKFDTKNVRELARYFTVTCHSLPTGNKTPCNGVSGCCAKDSYPEWLNRKAKKAQGPAQQVEMSHVNYPSRTAVDFDGTMWVSNRALYQQGAQSSVSKISPEPSRCIDFNNNGVIETSSDVNNDGVIQTDCNSDNVPDDIDNVKMRPCINGMAQEFYGLDDECVLLTTNTGDLDGWGRPLALGPGPMKSGPSDAWAGLFNTKQVFHIDGTSGVIKEEVDLPCQPYGFTIDSDAIGWAANQGPAGCYWDTRDVTKTGSIRQTNLGQSSYGIGLDRDKNLWFGGTAARYTPIRGKQFADLGNGYWTVITGISGSGVAVDSRSQAAYFAYFAGSYLYQVPASSIPLPNGADVMLDGTNFPKVSVDSGGKGVDIAVDGNVIVTSQSVAGITRVPVDKNGVMTQPVINGQPMGNNLCPTGDNCRNIDRQNADMQPYTYSDFTGFSFRNFTVSQGSYSYVQPGCVVNGQATGETRWVSVAWTATVPPKTTLMARVRSGDTPSPDISWGAWVDLTLNPADLVNTIVLSPNAMSSSYLQVEFDFGTTVDGMSPTLNSFYILHECV